VFGKRFDKRFVPILTVFHQLGYVDPQWVVLHFDRLKELESLRIQVETQAGERLGITIEKLRRLAARHAVNGGHALLTIEQQLNNPPRQRSVTAMGSGLGFGGPDEQPADRVTTIEGIEQTAHLIAVPDITALEFG